MHKQGSRLDEKGRTPRLTLPDKCIATAHRVSNQIGGDEPPLFGAEPGTEGVHGIERLDGLDEAGDAR
jgi:hypothetical protein